jgi:alkylhydroperoxidase family enzyme
MARMQGITNERAGWLVRALFAGIRRKAGNVSETFRIAGHNPRVLLGWSLFEAAIDSERQLDAKLRKLAELKTAAMVGCPV